MATNKIMTREIKAARRAEARKDRIAADLEAARANCTLLWDEAMAIPAGTPERHFAVRAYNRANAIRSELVGELREASK